MKYIFDTDSISFLYGDSADKEKINIIDNIQKLSGSDRLQVSILVLFELEYSCFLVSSEKQSLIKKVIEKTEKNFEILPLTQQVAIHYAELKGQLKQKYKISSKNMKRQ